MEVKEVLNFFKNKSKLAKSLNLTRQAVNNWIVREKIPYSNQVEIERITNGYLKACDHDEYYIKEKINRTKNKSSMFDKDIDIILSMKKDKKTYKEIIDKIGYGKIANLSHFFKRRS